MKFRSFALAIAGFILAIALTIGIQSVFAQTPSTVRDLAQYGTGIKRTLYLLSTSTPQHHNTVRILFYGQSITQQEWWLAVVDRLRRRFPYADIIVENRAIGGFASPLLVRTAEHDFYPFYPDLTIFHDYGDEFNYETMIANARSRTTSEIALMSDHVIWLPTGKEDETSKDLQTYQWHNKHVERLSAIALKYGCELIDIRTPWEKYLKERNRSPKTLLKDGVHLNDRGNRLMANLVTTHLLGSPIPTAKDLDNSVIDYRNLSWRDGKLKLSFTGNRVALISRSNSDRSLSAKILIDGKLPSQFPELYTITRPSDAYAVDFPALLRVSSQSPLLVEDWTAIATQISPTVDNFKFDLYGSETGFDGSGNSNEKFVSKSRRIAIAPQDWYLKTSYQFSKQKPPLGFQIRWRVEPLFVDIYTPPKLENPAEEAITVVAQNLSNTKHSLEIISSSKKAIPLDSIRIYRPPIVLKKEEPKDLKLYDNTPSNK
jgi:hypothetical protein